MDKIFIDRSEDLGGLGLGSSAPTRRTGSLYPACFPRSMPTLPGDSPFANATANVSIC